MSLVIDYTVPEDGKVYFSLTDMTGKTVMYKEVDAVKGFNQLDLTGLKGVAAGAYLISGIHNGERISAKLMK